MRQLRDCGSKKIQSPLAYSLSETRSPISRVCISRTSPREQPRYSAMLATSWSLTQTAPDSPVQQLPHCVQEKHNPGSYQSLSLMGGSVKTAARARNAWPGAVFAGRSRSAVSFRPDNLRPDDLGDQESHAQRLGGSGQRLYSKRVACALEVACYRIEEAAAEGLGTPEASPIP